MQTEKLYGIGVDFGTDSVRAALVAYDNGKVLNTASTDYPRWKQELYCDAQIAQFRQHPLDYQESLFATLETLVEDLSQEERNAIGSIGLGATGSTVAPVDAKGVPLALKTEFLEDPGAMFHLWKDHTASKEAKRFNDLCKTSEIDYTRYQGTYSSEWFWAKIAYTGQRNPAVKEASHTWLELCDWVVHVLTGSEKINYRSQCAAAHKALWNSHFPGLPSQNFLQAFDAYAALMARNYEVNPESCTKNNGWINLDWAQKLNLPLDVVIGGSSLDAHAGAVGAGVKEHVLVSVLGTSAVHMTLLPYGEEKALAELTYYAGLAEDSIVPGYWGVESGQAAFGDVLSWFSRCLAPFSDDPKTILSRLDTLIADSTVGSRLTCLEWLNGRRYPNGNDTVRGSLIGLDLSSDAQTIYGSLTNSILFGLKRILDGMQMSGLSVKTMRATGGIARKSPVLMQRLSSILNLPILALSEHETCALGASMYGAVALGKFASLQEAQEAMAAKEGVLYEPIASDVELFNRLYLQYLDVATIHEFDER